MPRIRVDTDYLTFFDRDAEVRATSRVNELLAGVVPLYVVVDGGKPEALREPEALRAIERLQQRLDAIPGVSRRTRCSTLRLLNRALEHDDPAQARIPIRQAGVAELFFLLPKSDLARFATVDQSSANLIGCARGGRLAGAARARLIEQADRRPAARLHARLTGNAVLLANAADSVAESQPRGIGATTAAIVAVL